MKTNKTKSKTPEEFEQRVDSGGSIFDAADTEIVPDQVLRMSLDIPRRFARRLDIEAAKRGVTRQSLVKMWLYEKLDKEPLTS